MSEVDLPARRAERNENSAGPACVNRSMRSNSTRNALGAALLFAVLAAASACNASPPPPDPPPALNDEKIRESIVQAWVQEVPEETGAAKPITWHFRRNEPTELTIVEKQIDGEQATVVVDVKTRTAPGSKSPRVLSGRLRLHYRVETELFLRSWRVVDVDNLSMKYRDEPAPAAQPAPGDGPGAGAGPPAPPPPPPPAP